MVIPEIHHSRESLTGIAGQPREPLPIFGISTSHASCLILFAKAQQSRHRGVDYEMTATTSIRVASWQNR